MDHPQLNACLTDLHLGDTRVVLRVDRLGRSMLHLVAISQY